MEDKIIQICPCSRKMHAVYAIEDGLKLEKCPVVCLALVEFVCDGEINTDIEPMVMGLDGQITEARDERNFLGIEKDDEPQMWDDEAIEYHKNCMERKKCRKNT